MNVADDRQTTDGRTTKYSDHTLLTSLCPPTRPWQCMYLFILFITKVVQK